MLKPRLNVCKMSFVPRPTTSMKATVSGRLRRSHTRIRPQRLAIPAVLGGGREDTCPRKVKSVEAVAMVDGERPVGRGDRSRQERVRRLLPEAGARHVFADSRQGNATMFAPTAPSNVQGARSWQR